MPCIAYRLASSFDIDGVAAVRLNPDLPSELERIIDKALEKDRNLRYQVAVEMRADLLRLKLDTESSRSTTTLVSPEKKPPARRGILTASLALLAGLAVLGALYFRTQPVSGISSVAVLAVRYNPTA